MKIRTQLRIGLWTYTVASGDSLFKIAKMFYGDGNLWSSIYNYKNNASVIGANPNLIRPGMVIKMWD